jgi:hypothetical protein
LHINDWINTEKTSVVADQQIWIRGLQNS